MQYSYKTITCCGDEACESFMREFLADLSEEMQDSIYKNGELSDIAFVNPSSFDTNYENLSKTKNICIFTSAKIPLGCILEFPAANFQPYSVISGEPCDKLILFNRFPYRKRSLVIKLADMLEEVKTIDSQVVLIKIDRRFASTDILSFEDALEIAKSDYAKIADRVCLYKSGEDKSELFRIKSSIIKNMLHHYIAKIDIAMERFNREFDVKYAKDVGFYVKKYEGILGAEPINRKKLTKMLREFYLYFVSDIRPWDTGVEDFLAEIEKEFPVNSSSQAVDGDIVDPIENPANAQPAIKNNSLYLAVKKAVNEKLISVLTTISVPIQ